MDSNVLSTAQGHLKFTGWGGRGEEEEEEKGSGDRGGDRTNVDSEKKIWGKIAQLVECLTKKPGAVPMQV